ncbi:hypothetical protein [Aquisphaera insulae]|uniref:hypothetical protein n=1 Tax=Aquisphaera insulae TaxID=2712864 RepID=UPI0013EB28EB|nr:hypothetical protein [Aquisphaera insulae]
MSDLDDEQLDRLESAHAVFARADGAARARLLAALAADVPPATFVRKSRIELMKRYAPGGAIAATVLIAACIAWILSQPPHLFAQVAGAMSRAQGFRCDMIQVSPGYNNTENAELVAHVFWNPSGEERLDHLQDDRLDESLIFRPGQNGLRISHGNRQFRIAPKSSSREYSIGLFGGLGNYRGKAEPIPGAKEIRGVKAEGFTVPWPTIVGDDTHPDAKVQVWIDRATSLPVRVDLVGMAPAPHTNVVMRFEDFRWGPQDPALFDITPPADYAKMPTSHIKADQITQYLKDGLAIFAKYNDGKYPAVKYVYGDQQGEALRSLMKMPREAQGWALNDDLEWRKTKEGEFAYGSYCLSWINSLQRDFPEAVYNGKTVTPRDAGKVLVRWQLDDGDYRVIFGDLTSATVPADRLREIEGR